MFDACKAFVSGKLHHMNEDFYNGNIDKLRTMQALPFVSPFMSARITHGRIFGKRRKMAKIEHLLASHYRNLILEGRRGVFFPVSPQRRYRLQAGRACPCRLFHFSARQIFQRAKTIIDIAAASVGNFECSIQASAVARSASMIRYPLLSGSALC
jgi:hypothetical protein